MNPEMLVGAYGAGAAEEVYDPGTAVESAETKTGLILLLPFLSKAGPGSICAAATACSCGVGCPKPFTMEDAGGRGGMIAVASGGGLKLNLFK